MYLWNDRAILSEQNDAVKAALTSMADPTIKVVVRDDGSGTSEIFTKAGPGNGGQGERLVPPHTR